MSKMLFITSAAIYILLVTSILFLVNRTPTNDSNNSNTPSIVTNGVVFELIGGKKWAGFDVYKFNDNSNTHYIVVSAGGGVAIK